MACGPAMAEVAPPPVTAAEEVEFKPRDSVPVALTVIEPASAPVVFSVAVLPLPEMVPPLAVQPLTFTAALSGLCRCT